MHKCAKTPINFQPIVLYQCTLVPLDEAEVTPQPDSEDLSVSTFIDTGKLLYVFFCCCFEHIKPGKSLSFFTD